MKVAEIENFFPEIYTAILLKVKEFRGHVSHHHTSVDGWSPEQWFLSHVDHDWKNTEK